MSSERDSNVESTTNSKNNEKIEKLENFLKNQKEDSATEDYINMMKSILSKIQHSKEFSEELRKYKALGNKIRYSIYKFLEHRELCACEISVLFDIKEATISHHLKILADAKLIKGNNKGYYVVYKRKDEKD